MPDSSSPASNPFRRAARIAAVMAWAALIFAASARPDLRVASDDLVDLIVRKAAHVVVFGVLALLVARAVRGEGVGTRSTLIVAWLGTLAYAASDEWHQTWVPGRVGHAGDVAIDMVGASIAVAYLARRWRQQEAPRERAA